MLIIFGIAGFFISTSFAIEVRLVNGTNPNEGRVELRHTPLSHWSTVCGTYWDINDVIVTCRQLGFPGAHASLKNSEFGRGTGKISRTLLFCRGGENNLDKCSKSRSLLCRDGSTAGVVCQELGYLGCYGDKPHARALGDEVHVSPNMSVMMCIDRCRQRGYAYAGLEYGEECYCGSAASDYKRYGRDWDSGCQNPCAGYPRERCGGIGKIAIYRTNATGPVVTPSTKITSNTKPTMAGTVSTKSITKKHNRTQWAAPSTTEMSGVLTERMRDKVNSQKGSDMIYLAVVMGSLLLVGILISGCVLVWNFKLRSRMRELEDQDSPMADLPDPDIDHLYEDKKIQFVYSDLLSNDVTDNHYEALIIAENGNGKVIARRDRRQIDPTDRYSQLPSLPNLPNCPQRARVPTYFAQSDLYENYQYSEMN